MAIEEPKFEVLEEFSGIEIRRMSAYWTVEIELEGDEKEVGNQEKTSSGKFRIGFVLPAEFNSRKPPEPLDSRLKLRLVPERTLATLRYRGSWSIERFTEKKSTLLAAVTQSGKWQLAGEPLWSRYDPPFMPWFLRRNEVQVEVKPTR
ncbi:MAG: hypothetical protein OHK0011_14630 [Turneriella sp.]